MSLFNYTNDAIPAQSGRVLGAFVEKDYGVSFEYATRKYMDIWSDYPHRIAVGPNGDETRVGKVLKTVAYIVIDEDADGNPVVEKWTIKNHRIYAK
jgi:hypothetical protein